MKKKISIPKVEMPREIKRDIFIVIIFLIAIFSLISLFNLAGKAGQFLDQIWQWVFGWGWWVWPFMLFGIGYFAINKDRLQIKFYRWLGFFLFVLSYSGILHFFIGSENFLSSAKQGAGGGYLGYFIAWPLNQIAGFWGGLIILISILIVSIILLSEKTLSELKEGMQSPQAGFFSAIKNKFKKGSDEKEFDEDILPEEIGFEQKEVSDKEVQEKIEGRLVGNLPEDQKEMFPNIRKRFQKIEMPLDLLSGKTGQPTAGDTKANQEVIRRTFQYFGIEVEMGEISVGPTVTEYTMKPASGVKVAQILSLNNDLALALAAHPIRIQAPIPGKSLVGIEVPNQKIAIVSLKDILLAPEFKQRHDALTIALGKDVSGKPWTADLDRMPHLLLAGATGSGKTVCLNSIIISLLYGNQPDELKFIMIDPKRVELPSYNGIPHLVCPVIVDVKKTINALHWSVREMERRFQVLSNAGKRNITAYNISNPNDKLPYIVIVIDELADLMATAANEVEASIVRLAQMARAVGIHLVLATQRPSVEVITGLIKANITSRIAFSVASLIDSRTILDMSGAEKLLGRGDMLFSTPEISKPKRIQGAFVSDDEIERVVNFLKQKGEPEYEEGVTEKIVGNGSLSGNNNGSNFGSNFDDEDELLPDAKEFIMQSGRASASYLQRRLGIGYSRAAKILDLLEEQGIVGPQNGSKPREVLVKKGSREEEIMDIVNDGVEEEINTENNFDDIPTPKTEEENPIG
jgi:S-DNA-T family DNA segregation ATPase FtsK/SpoIIIE